MATRTRDYEVIRAKDGWHVIRWFRDGIHPEYRAVSGPHRLKSEAVAAMERWTRL